jgi:hypothetical protein
VAATEGKDQDQHTYEQSSVYLREINLPFLCLAGVVNRHAGQYAELHALTSDGVGARDQGLACDNCGQRGKQNQGQAQPLWPHQEERVLGRLGGG